MDPRRGGHHSRRTPKLPPRSRWATGLWTTCGRPRRRRGPAAWPRHPGPVPGGASYSQGPRVPATGGPVAAGPSWCLPDPSRPGRLVDDRRRWAAGLRRGRGVVAPHGGCDLGSRPYEDQRPCRRPAAALEADRVSRRRHAAPQRPRGGPGRRPVVAVADDRRRYCDRCRCHRGRGRPARRAGNSFPATAPQRGAKVRTALDRRRAHPWRDLLSAVLAVAANGAKSPIEVRYAPDVETAHRLPVGVRQHPTDPARRAHHDVAYPA